MIFEAGTVMTLNDLRLLLVQYNVPTDAYCLTGGLPNEAYAIEQEEGLWRVYYSVRGFRVGVREFLNESDACQDLLARVIGIRAGGRVVCNMERRFLPALRAAQSEFSADFPDVRTTAWSQSCGEATDSPGQVIGLSCFFPQAPLDQPDEVSLTLSIGGVRGPGPTLDVDVCWSDPGGLEADLFPKTVPLSEEALQKVDAELPRLIEVLRTAVRRGRPH
jgi:hypothetical protein